MSRKMRNDEKCCKNISRKGEFENANLNMSRKMKIVNAKRKIIKKKKRKIIKIKNEK
jgi:hypothetical protein